MQKETKVLFLGGNHLQLPYLKAINALGYHTILTDMNEDSPCKNEVNTFYRKSYTDYEALIDIGNREGFNSSDKVFTASSHIAYQGAAAFAERFSIPFLSPDNVDILLNKCRTYDLFRELDIPIPPTEIFDADTTVDPHKVYYLKSDYSKSPYYIFRITDARIPELPREHDPFYQGRFLLQEEIRGTQYRINIFHNRAQILLKVTPSSAIPVTSLGKGHDDILKKLFTVMDKLDAHNFLLKFDIMADNDSYYPIDIGLDPPSRLRLLTDHFERLFAEAYVKHYLLGQDEYLPTERLHAPVLIQGNARSGYSTNELL